MAGEPIVFLNKAQTEIKFRLEGMIQRGRSPSAYLNRKLLAQFKDAQKERWQTSNASQQGTWRPLNPSYLKRRRRLWPASGDAILTRTQRMAKGAQGLDTAYYYKIVTDDRFVFGINESALPYAQYPGRTRPFMSFTTETLTKWHEGIGNYIFRGVDG